MARKDSAENHMLALKYLYLEGTYSISIYILLIKANPVPNVKKMEKRDPPICPERDGLLY